MRYLTYCLLAAAMFAAPAGATYVEPTMGGGQSAWGEVAMKHADISFTNGTIDVVIDESVPIPWLVPLEEGLSFDPEGIWGMINGDAYNFQYGWNPSRFDAYPPDNSSIWIEQLDASPELRTYQRPPANPEGQPIFGTDGSSLRWRWSGSMTHNLYAIANPLESEYFATYRVYIGDDSTGEPLAGFVADEVTFTFFTNPVIPGDYDRSGTVDLADYATWKASFGQSAPPGSGADGSLDGTVGLADYTVWRDHFSANAGVFAPSEQVAEPSTEWSLCLLLAAVGLSRFRRG
ncbi:hypothetical protein [Aeoliella mucimassa]|uniref:PEP-CTERM protein-sorting domain-containing protein n=1 Tax=Aeoliella mucimassa TaxID=2527972 RepID=A0A518AHR5_9BACT|nr:hypothetical protein [Aeoliella mucimassa]QDU54245.1 hypothetical protein Pan181_04250 [Aeoliella mucimassa]